MTAMLLLPLTITVALAVDFSSYIVARSQIDLAADAAALQAVRMASQYYAAGSVTLAAAQTAGAAAGQQWFAAQAGTIRGANVTSTNTSINVTYQASPASFVATVTYTGTVATTLGSFITPSWPIARSAVAELPNGAPYVDIIVLLDNSSSMELPSTAAGIASLTTLTTGGTYGACAYACHYTTTKDASGNFADYYGIARHNNIELRFDVIIAALTNMISTIQSNNANGTYRLAIYTFDSSLHSVFPLSNTLTSAAASLNAVTLPLSSTSGTSDTNFVAAMSSLDSQTLAAGDGTTPSAPRKFLFILTDGVEDAAGAMTSRTVTVFNPASCTSIKAKGVTTSIVYTKYLASNDTYYNAWIAPISSLIVPSLQACASTAANYYLATDGPSIQAGISQLLTSSISVPARIKQ